MKNIYTLLMILGLGLTSALSGQTRSETKLDRKFDSERAAVVLTVTAPTKFVAAATAVTLALTVSDTTGNGVLGYRGEITYNPTVLQTIGGNAGCTVAGTISSAYAPFCSESVINATTRKITFFLFGSSPLSGAGDLIRFNFQVIGDPGTSTPLLFTDFFFNEGSPGDPVDLTLNGLITVVPTTAAGVAVSGRLLTPDGNGIKNAVVLLTDPHGFARQTISSSFGYFSFADVPAGSTFVLSVGSKRYQFSPQLIAVSDDVTGLDLVGTPID